MKILNSNWSDSILLKETIPDLQNDISPSGRHKKRATKRVNAGMKFTLLNRFGKEQFSNDSRT